MLQIEHDKAANMLVMRLGGQIDSDDMNTSLAQLFDAAETMRKGRILCFAQDVKVPTMAALGVELRHLPRLFGIISRFDRCAVVANQEWVRRWSKFEGVIFPSLNMKVFEADQEAEARAYLETGDDAASERS